MSKRKITRSFPFFLFFLFFVVFFFCSFLWGGGGGRGVWVLFFFSIKGKLTGAGDTLPWFLKSFSRY